MKRLLKYLKDYTKESILAPLFKLLEAGFELFVPLLIYIRTGESAAARAAACAPS